MFSEFHGDPYLLEMYVWNYFFIKLVSKFYHLIKVKSFLLHMQSAGASSRPLEHFPFRIESLPILFLKKGCLNLVKHIASA